MNINQLNSGAPDPIEDLSPFVYNMEAQNDGLYYYKPHISTHKYFVPQVNPDGTDSSYLSDTPSPQNTASPLPAAQTPVAQPLASAVTADPITEPTQAPQANTATATTSTANTPNPVQSITNTLDKILGITVNNNNTTNVVNTTDVATNTALNTAVNNNINNDTNNLTAVSNLSNTSNTANLTNTTNTANIEDGVPVNTPQDISSYGKPVIIGGIAGMIIAKLAKKDIFWGFILGAGGLSLYQYYRTNQISQ